MRLNNLIEKEGPADLDMQAARRNLLRQFLQRRLHEVARFAGVGGEAHCSGDCLIGVKSLNDHLLPTIPVMQTMPPCLAQRSEPFRVVVPTSSSTLSTPFGKAFLTSWAIDSVSIKT